MNNYQDFNVQASYATLVRLINSVESARVVTEFSRTDWNIRVPNDDVDYFTDWLDRRGIEYEQL